MKGLVVQIRNVLMYLHRRFIVHRDIKPSNVLCERGEDGSVQVCLADFGIATHANKGDDISKRCGTAGYIAPEILEEEWTESFSSPLATPQVAAKQVLKTDIFSFGVLVYELALGVNPFVGPTLRETFISNARGVINAEENPRLSVELQDLLNCFTARNPHDRCSIFDGADRRWFQADLRALGFAGVDEDLRGYSVAWEVFEEESRRR